MYKKLIRKIQVVLTPDLLKKEYRINNPPALYGFCYIASEALWHLTNKVLFVYCARDINNIVHWWLSDGKNIIDPTKEQYTNLGKLPPYSKGKRCGFLTKEPSKRCKEILRRISTT